MDCFYIYIHSPSHFSLLNLYIIIIIIIIVIRTVPNIISKFLHPNYTYIQTYKPNKVSMAPTNKDKSPVNQVPLAEADLAWYGIILGIMPFGEEIRTGGYVKQCADSEAAGEAAILPTKEQLKLMLDNLGPGNRELLHEALDALKSSKSVGKSTKA